MSGRMDLRVEIRREEWISRRSKGGRAGREEGEVGRGFRDSWIQRGWEGRIIVVRKRVKKAGRKS